MASDTPAQQTALQPARKTVLGEVITWVKTGFDVAAVVAAGAAGSKIAQVITGVEALEPQLLTVLVGIGGLYAAGRRVVADLRK